MSTHSDRTLTKAPLNNLRTKFLWEPIIFCRFWQKIISTLEKLFSEKNVLSLNSAAIAWQNFCAWKPILFLSHNTLAFDRNDTYLEEIILGENVLCLNSAGVVWKKSEYDFSTVIINLLLTEITSTLQKLLSEKNKLESKFFKYCMTQIFFV